MGEAYSNTAQFFKKRTQTKVTMQFPQDYVGADPLVRPANLSVAKGERARRDEIKTCGGGYRYIALHLVRFEHRGRMRPLRALSLTKFPISLQHTSLGHDPFQPAKICPVHDGNEWPPVHVAQSHLERMIWMKIRNSG